MRTDLNWIPRHSYEMYELAQQVVAMGGFVSNAKATEALTEEELVLFLKEKTRLSEESAFQFEKDKKVFLEKVELNRLLYKDSDELKNEKDLKFEKLCIDFIEDQTKSEVEQCICEWVAFMTIYNNRSK